MHTSTMSRFAVHIGDYVSLGQFIPLSKEPDWSADVVALVDQYVETGHWAKHGDGQDRWRVPNAMLCIVDSYECLDDKDPTRWTRCMLMVIGYLDQGPFTETLSSLTQKSCD